MVEKIVVGSLHTNSYIFFAGKKECIIIDPGSDEKLILKRLSVLNLTPKLIVFTHGHLDHASASMAIIASYANIGKTVRTAAHEKEKTFFGKRSEKKHRLSFDPLGAEGEMLFAEYYQGMPEIDIPLQDGQLVPETDLTVLHTPGHTQGSICLYSESKKVLFSGDTLFFEGVGRSDLPGGSKTALLKNIREKLMTLPPETRVFPGHGPQTTIEREVSHNPFIRRN